MGRSESPTEFSIQPNEIEPSTEPSSKPKRIGPSYYGKSNISSPDQSLVEWVPEIYYIGLQSSGISLCLECSWIHDFEVRRPRTSKFFEKWDQSCEIEAEHGCADLYWNAIVVSEHCDMVEK